MRSKLQVAAILAILTVATSFARDDATPAAAPTPQYGSISGQLAFSDTIVFDYDRDGTPNRVQFWIDLQGTPVAGDPAEPDTSPVAGSVSYFVLDLDKKRRIDNWLLAFNMGEGFPVAGQPYPITNLRITEKTARFDLSGSSWTITDNGDKWGKDVIVIETAGRKRTGRFYGGDVKVTPGPLTLPEPAKAASVPRPPSGQVPGSSVKATPVPAAAPELETTAAAAIPQPAQAAGVEAKSTPPASAVTKPADIAANSRCNRCHREAAVSIAAYGGPHSTLKCASCHTKHPKVVKDAVPQCLNCHNRHAESMSITSCSICHQSHAILTIQYGLNVPDQFCASCHKKSASDLRESGTLHAGLSCVICHSSDHGNIPACTYCHGGPHSKRVMSKPDGCAKCHNTAHQTTTD